MKEKKAGRVGEIDLFRWIFSIIILLRHASNLLGKNLVFPGGAFAVEFFFLVSGYLMMASIEKVCEKGTENLGRETVCFLKRKVRSLFPEVVLAFVIGFIVCALTNRWGWPEIAGKFMKSTFEVLLVQRTGVGSNQINNVVWYIQSMLLCMAILYPLIRKFPDMMKHIGLLLIALLLLGYLEKNEANLRTPSKWLGWTYKGNVRAMAELCLGAACYSVVDYLRKLNLTKLAKVLLTVVKWICWIPVLAYMWDSKWKYDLFMLGIMCIAVMLAFSCQCVDVSLYQNKIVAWLGAFSLPIYLSHFFYACCLPLVLPENMRYRYMLLCYVLCSVVTAFVVMFLAGQIRKHGPKVSAALKARLLEKA